MEQDVFVRLRAREGERCGVEEALLEVAVGGEMKRFLASLEKTAADDLKEG